LFLKGTGYICWKGGGSHHINELTMAKALPRVPVLLLGWLMSCQLGSQGSISGATLEWQKLSPVPNRAGLGAPFAGVSHGRLLVAGGANFPQAAPWEGGQKVWYDVVYALSQVRGEWEIVGQLPRPLAYGVSLTASDGMVCLGGSDAHRHYRDAFVVECDGGKIRIKPLPPLPQPMANGSGAMLGKTLYIAGGIERPDSTRALRTFWALDLAARQPAWHELEPWPGRARMLAVAAVQDGAFFLVSGVDLSSDVEGKPVRHYLRDVYRYEPGAGWSRKADIPRAAVAAPSPAPPWGQTHFLVLSGDDGTKLGFQPPEQHPGFAKDILAYDTTSDTWTDAGQVPATQVTVPAVAWNRQYVFPNGEIRPGVRTPEIWSLSLPDAPASRHTSKN
jgi:N-acetylneuraminic acid mutarotase